MTHFVADKRPGVFQRRQDTCRLLDRCEFGWVRAHGSAQARCPPGCASYAGPGAAALPEEAPPRAAADGAPPADARRCLYCNAALPVREGVGRPRRFCVKRRCKQRWSEGRAELEGAGT